jgi:DNA repair protein RecO (recombination protein O)
MPLQESEAIVLRSYPLGEADRLVSFLSRSSGRLRGVARGARRPKSRFGSSLEPLSHIRIWFYERESRELVRISQCELLESFFDAQVDYRASCALSLIAEVVEAVLPEREPSESSFRLMLHVARQIRESRETTLPIAYFAIWIVRLSGWLGDLSRCARCGASLVGSPAYGTVASSGFVCGKCRSSGMRMLSEPSLDVARQFFGARLDQLGAAKDHVRAVRELADFFLDVIEHQLERKLASRPMLDVTV